MLSSLAAKPQQGRELWSGLPPTVARSKAIWYSRAGNRYVALPPSGAHRTRILEPLTIPLLVRGRPRPPARRGQLCLERE